MELAVGGHAELARILGDAESGMQPQIMRREHQAAVSKELRLSDFSLVSGSQGQRLTHVLSLACLLELPTLDWCIESLVPRFFFFFLNVF